MMSTDGKTIHTPTNRLKNAEHCVSRCVCTERSQPSRLLRNRHIYHFQTARFIVDNLPNRMIYAHYTVVTNDGNAEILDEVNKEHTKSVCVCARQEEKPCITAQGKR